jgi:CheY-like chemotaxis protein/HPt (histidine-containing phosphotransfer) domain-containing protein
LLAEDNETNRDVMQQQLRLLGYASEVAEDGLVALEMWRSGRYALLLTDCHMPRMDGFALTAAIRQAEPAGTHLPIVAITANAMQGEAQRCMARGMDDYLSKPMRMEDLAPLLHKWLPLPQTFVRELQMARPHTGEPSLLAIWDEATLGEMVGDSQTLQRSLLEKYLTNAEQQVTAIQSAILEGAFASAADLSHALKSSSRMVGAVQLGELSDAIENAGVEHDVSTCHSLSPYLNFAYRSTEAMIRTHLASPDPHTPEGTT